MHSVQRPDPDVAEAHFGDWGVFEAAVILEQEWTGFAHALFVADGDVVLDEDAVNGGRDGLEEILNRPLKGYRV